jgi:Uma2 family endonuclease
MTTLTRPRRPAARPLHAPLLSAADFVALPGEDKADLIHGRIVSDMQPTYLHEVLVSLLHFVLKGFADARGLGEVLGSKSPILIDERNVFEPDVVFVSAVRRSGIRADGLITGGADVAVEVVSPSSKRRDYADKRAGYERAGVAEYWIVDPMRGEAQFHRLSADGLYTDVSPAAGEAYESQALPGFRLDPAHLFAEDRPTAFALLTELLG